MYPVGSHTHSRCSNPRGGWAAGPPPPAEPRAHGAPRSRTATQRRSAARPPRPGRHSPVGRKHVGSAALRRFTHHGGVTARGRERRRREGRGGEGKGEKAPRSYKSLRAEGASPSREVAAMPPRKAPAKRRSTDSGVERDRGALSQEKKDQRIALFLSDFDQQGRAGRPAPGSLRRRYRSCPPGREGPGAGRGAARCPVRRASGRPRLWRVTERRGCAGTTAPRGGAMAGVGAGSGRGPAGRHCRTSRPPLEAGNACGNKRPFCFQPRKASGK